MQAEAPEQGRGPGEQGAERAVPAVLAEEDVAGGEDFLGWRDGLPRAGEEDDGNLPQTPSKNLDVLDIPD